ncbi:putative cytochrome p450 pisatin protein [Phialemonium atrogriseum]|uniref:Cytochrome p450 pisatin protein n=1 Tax=Phialemonium atrogriseum TaxID=1093897 RepID=A0AAJ0CAT9_9PEZI|nr:putative cytochrome p450 pisatin protein [Phialemonium atrogriseum]KAK1771877.1 putative cytochrome p450 pisatin protein [Phialemonium atrogriseum]
MHINLILGALLTALLAHLLRALYAALTSPLRHIPGPPAARLTRLWYLWRVRGARFEHDNVALHRQHGPLVRLAPDHYSLDDPAAVRAVYGFGAGGAFAKSDWYYGWQHPDPDRWTLFPDRDVRRHAETRRRFQALYSMSGVVAYEPFVDACGDLLVRRLGEVAGEGFGGGVVDMAHWFQCYAFDVVACITYGRRLGFLDRGEDVDGVIAALDRTFVYGSLIGIYPRLHPLAFRLSARFSWSGARGRLKIMEFVQRQIARRRGEREERKRGGKGEGVVGREGLPEDFLDKMMDQNEENPEKVTEYHVFMMGLSNVIAGSDTTAASLSAILYYLLKYPRTLTKLKDEISVFTAQGKLSDRVTFSESQKMPYFQAVMKEALRMHAATGLPLWRVVPEGGAHISGQFFPAGSVVGINTWSAHYNRDVFGADADGFRPERWIEAEEAAEAGNKDMLRRMDAYYMPFGLGSRTCIGRHISTLEMSKIIPRLLREFDFELERPEWKTENFWFVKPKDFIVRVRRAGAQ